MAIITEPFEQVARTQCSVLGKPDQPFVVVPHPTCRLSEEQVGALADRIVDRVRGLLVDASAGSGRSVGAAAGEVAPRLIRVEETLEAAQEAFLARGWTDGLPIVPPTRQRVEAMLKGIDCRPQHCLGVIPPRMGQATVEKVAINAVMAGCRPAYMPVVVAAVEAMLEPQFNLAGVQATQNEVAPLTIVHGPIARELKINNGIGLFGPGWQANATIGRAIRLTLLNIGGAQPGPLDKSTLGSPGKYTFCIAENEQMEGWDPLYVDLGLPRDTNAVTVVAAGSPQITHFIGINYTQDLLDSIARVLKTPGNNSLAMGPELLLLVAPEMAKKLAEDGYTKDGLRTYLWEHSTFGPGELYPDQLEYMRTRRPAHFRNVGGEKRYGMGERPEDFLIMVAGGPSGPQVALIPFYWSRAVTRPIKGRTP